MRLKKFSRFAIVMAGINIVLGLSWLMFEEGELLDDDAFPGFALFIGGLSLLLYTMRNQDNVVLKEYHDTRSLDNELLFSETGHVDIIRNNGFTRVLGIISAIALIIWTVLAIFYMGWFLERPKFSRINEPGEIVGMSMALITLICVVPTAIFILRTFDARWVRSEG